MESAEEKKEHAKTLLRSAGRRGILMRVHLLIVAALCGAADALVVAPALRPAPQAARSAPVVRMQVAEPPVKIPDKVPQFAPVEPKGNKQDEKGKKYKLLLFNDNVNRCAAAQQYFLRDSALRRRLRASCPRLLVQARVCCSGACADHPRADPGRRVHRDAEGAQVGDGGGGRVGL